MQQTRVAQGTAYYEKFIAHYPTLIELANAEEEEIMKDWQGLGYYSRARNLHATAKYIRDELNGVFPKDYKEIRSLKGIGDYTAAAIASFAFDLPYAVLDGNVFRLLSRYFGIELPIDRPAGKKYYQAIANELLNQTNPAEHNQAIMEFGALQCIPKNPDCGICPLQTRCIAFNTKKVSLLPIKENKIKQSKRYFHYFLIEEKGKIIIKKRQEKDIWQQLYDFPLIETNSATTYKELSKSQEFINYFKDQDIRLEAASSTYKHILSHQQIFATFYHIKVIKFASLSIYSTRAVPIAELIRYPIPKLIENYLKEATNLLSLFK